MIKIGFIGTGNMGGAIIRGYGARAEADGNELLAYNRTRAKAEAVAKDVPLTVAGSIEELVRASDIVFVCVEPANFDEVMPEVARLFGKDKMLVSIAAGITIAYLEGHLGADAKIVRSMPNTPIMHGLGTTALVRNANVSDSDFEAVKKVFEAGGIAGEVSENQISAVIGVSGSSPAYTYMYIDTLAKAGTSAGLDPETSRRFAAQAVMGAACMAMKSDEELTALCDRVCTPGGTTIEAVKRLRELGFEETIKNGAEAAIARADEMSK